MTDCESQCLVSDGRSKARQGDINNGELLVGVVIAHTEQLHC